MTEQKTPTPQQLTEALNTAPPIVLASGPRETPTQIPPVPHDVWDLPGGTAWVYYGEGKHGLTRPVIIADGFNSGPSDVGMLWEGLDRRDYAFLSEIRRSGRDVVIVGFHERSAPIQHNARAALAAIERATHDMSGGHGLAVGGFSMGGLVTRYALLKLEHRRTDHRTELYFSYDSPHRGAWIPIGLQAFAHYIRDLDDRFSDQMNSPAAKQLLWQHIADWPDTPATHQDRTDFLDELERMGNWPARPRKIGVANGVGTGEGNGIEPGDETFRGLGLAITGTSLYAQRTGDEQLVAKLRVLTLESEEIRTSGLPDIDGAPGGTLEGFGILADSLDELPLYYGMRSEALVREHCFVPAVSAVDLREIASRDDLYTPADDIPSGDSGLDEYKLASRNEGHTVMTEELGSWIIERLP
ncbi:esterase/lipase family protein [Streptomyces sp. NPDC088358]|uniref:esterase/lipase family protein n=1 Tax=Streptomyces sp. NPDC088358 TaxID=3365857 RepID=UPI00382057AB